MVKIDYGNGSGSGAVLWRLGKDGDFTTTSPDPYPWFSHQHGAVPLDGAALSLFDNGNVRCQGQQDCPSRGMVWQLDEGARTAIPSLSVTLPYSLALGSSQRLANGSYSFTSGSQEVLRTSDAIELTAGGATSLGLHSDAGAYRAYRQRTLHRHTLDGTLPPEVVSLPPLVVSQGTSSSGLTLALVDDPDSAVLSASVPFVPAGLSVSSVGVSGGGAVAATLEVACGATLGPRRLTLALSDGRSYREVDVPLTVSADATPPLVTAPPPTVVEQSLCSGTEAGASPETSEALDALLRAGSASDACTPSPLRLSPQVGGADVGASTFFPVGPTTVSIRFQDGSGNVGSASSSVTVRRRGDLDSSGTVDVQDVVILANAIVGNVAPGATPYTASRTTGDANDDGALDVFDLLLQQALIVGNTACLPEAGTSPRYQHP